MAHHLLPAAGGRLASGSAVPAAGGMGRASELPAWLQDADRRPLFHGSQRPGRSGFW